MQIESGEGSKRFGEGEVERYEQLLCDEIERLMERVEEKVKRALQVFCESINEGLHPREAYLRALKKLPRV